MKKYVVVIGASAGGLAAIQQLLALIPMDFPAPILLVMHVHPHEGSHLSTVLNRHTKLNVRTAQDMENLEAGCVYVAPANLHMTVEEGLIRIQHGPKVNHCRPAIDPLFYSAASTYGSCAIGIILSGLLDDGTAGLIAIKHHQGITIVQDLNEAEYPDMPRNALKHAPIDKCLPIKEIANELTRLVHRPIPEMGYFKKHDFINYEVKMSKTLYDIPEDELTKIGKPSVFACPECHGVLWEVTDETMLRFRCRVGHAFGSDTLAESIDENIEDALWAALRALEERENLLRKIGLRMEKQGKPTVINFAEKAKMFKRNIEIIRSLLKSES